MTVDTRDNINYDEILIEQLKADLAAAEKRAGWLEAKILEIGNIIHRFEKHPIYAIDVIDNIKVIVHQPLRANEEKR